MAKKYLEIREKLTKLGNYELESELKNVIKLLSELEEDFKSKGYHYLHFNFTTEAGYYGDVENIVELYGTRTETDKERNERLKVNRRARLTKKERDKEIFIELKAKYNW